MLDTKPCGLWLLRTIDSGDSVLSNKKNNSTTNKTTVFLASSYANGAKGP